MARNKIISSKEAIIDTSLNIINEEGVNSLSIRKIASRMNVSSMTLYNYVENVDDIKKEVVIEGFRKLYKESYCALLSVKKHDGSIHMREGCIDLARVLFKFGCEYHGLFQLMFCSSDGKFRNDAEILPFYGYFANLLRRKGTGRNAADHNRTLQMLDHIAKNLILERIQGVHAYTAEEYEAYIEVFVSKMFDNEK